MQVQRVQTPYGVLEVSAWSVNGHAREYPVGTVRVRTPEGYFKRGETEDDEVYVPGQWMTIDHMVDLRVDLVVLPDGTPQAFSHHGYHIFYPLPEQGPGVSKYPEGEDLEKILKVAVEAAESVRDEAFLQAAERAATMEAHLCASKDLYNAQQDVKRAEKALAEALAKGKSLGLEESMQAQERELEKYRNQ